MERPLRCALVGAELEENLALRYLAGALQEAGIEWRIVVFNGAADAARAVAEIRSFAPDLVGLSLVFTHRAREFLGLATALRRAGYRGHVTAGGHFATFNHARLIEDVAALDSVLHHEGERRLVALARHLDDPGRVDGITFRAADGTVRVRPPEEALDDLDALPDPIHASPPDDYFGVPIANVIGSRGCYAGCAFCSIQAWHRASPSKRFRLRSPGSIAGEVAALHRGSGVRIFNFHDDNFFLPSRRDTLARLDALRDAFRERKLPRIAIAVKARPDDLDDEVLDHLEALGLFRIFLGIETMADDGLRWMRRGVDATRNREALELVRRRGVHCCYNLQVFNDAATLDTVEADIRQLEAFPGFPMNFCRTEVYEGTAVQARLAAEGRLLGDYLGYDYRLRDPGTQALFRIVAVAFRERNFRADGLHHLAMHLDYRMHVLRHFFPSKVRPGLVREVQETVAAVNLDTATRLRAALDWVRAHPEAGDAERRAFAEALREDVRHGERELAPVLRALDQVLEALRAGDAGRFAERVDRFTRMAAAALVALGLGATGGCFGQTQMSEMAPDWGADTVRDAQDAADVAPRWDATEDIPQWDCCENAPDWQADVADAGDATADPDPWVYEPAHEWDDGGAVAEEVADAPDAPDTFCCEAIADGQPTDVPADPNADPAIPDGAATQDETTTPTDALPTDAVPSPDAPDAPPANRK